MKIEVKPQMLQVYRSLLPPGSQMRIAKMAGVSRQSVSAYLNGRSQSWVIERAVLDVIAEFKKERDAKLRAAGLL